MHKKAIWSVIALLTLAALSCQVLTPEPTATPRQGATALPTSGPGGAPTALQPPTAPSGPRSTATAATPPATGGLPGILRDPVNETDQATADALAHAIPGVRDLRALAIRLKGVPADTPTIDCTTSPDYAVGATRTFNAENESTQETFPVNAVLRYKNDVVYMWIAQGVRYDDSRVKDAADFFASKIYPTDRALLGSEAKPGIDCDPHVSILNTPGLGGAAGYVTTKDSVTKAVRPDSNEMEMIYMNTEAFGGVGGADYKGVLAHEFQHVIAGNTHRNLETWMNEGFSDLCIYLNGFDIGRHPSAYLAAPNTQLNAWDELERSIPHYGASFLFLAYFYDRFGADGTKSLVADPNNGLTAIDNTLAKLKPGMTADDLYQDWQIANYVNDPKVGGGIYAYKDLRFNPPKIERTINQSAAPINTTVNHYGSQYYALKGDRDVTVSLAGATKARLIGSDPTAGKMMWYSGRGDDSDFTLTREFDLSGKTSATLQFQTWYDIEQDWDYFYVEASTDGGKTWKILKTPDSTDTNPSGNSYGWAMTGKSGSGDRAAWVQQTADLSSVAGGKVQVRFEYITDDALNFSGVALQDIRIPEIGYSYNADSGDGGWQALGFVRTTNYEPEKYGAQLISVGQDGAIQVQRLTVAPDQSGHWQVPLSQLKNAVLVLSAFARTTLEPAPYRLQVTENK